jgi:acyl-CoA synthetase (AMP-forming)/AMP-acid ligase II/acyl carrier protein
MRGPSRQLGPFDPGIEPSTLIELVQYRAAKQPHQIAYVFLRDGVTPTASLTYQELDLRARALGARLQQMNAAGERVLLLFPPGLEFHEAFLGCLYAGAVAVSAYPPRMNRSLERLQALISDAEACIGLTTSAILSRVQPVAEHLRHQSGFQWLATEAISTDVGEWRLPDVVSSRLAFLQYTSGSTGTPRGVRLTHANLLHNAQMVYEAGEHSPDDKYVSWLPTFHDMGFMVGVLQPLYAGIPAVLMPPMTFLQNPVYWLQAISGHKATISGGPNFAYELCTRKVTLEQRTALDLSRWSVAFNGAEPIQAKTIEDFAAAFASCGFQKKTFYPCYGLAEATLIVSGGQKNDLPILRRFRKSALEKGRIEEVEGFETDSKTLVSCGRALGDQQIRIVDHRTGFQCPSQVVGEIWVSGESVANGYWRKAEKNKDIFGAYLGGDGAGPYLRTGDLGFIKDGELYVTGRLKDLIIIRGVNHYPQDIEQTIEKCHSALRSGCGASFSLEIEGEEHLVIVQEIDGPRRVDLNSIAETIRQAVSQEHQLQAHTIVFIKKGAIPKTSSGKIQRYACKAAFLEGSLQEIERDTLDDRASVNEESSFIEEALQALPPNGRRDLLENYVQKQVARLLKIPTNRLANDRPLSTFGLDSLNAIEIKNLLEQELRVTIPLRQILETASVRDLAEQTLRRLDAPGTRKGQPGEAAVTTTEFPLSYMQRSFWLIHQLAWASPAYNVAFAVRILSELDFDCFHLALREVIERHSCLRSIFQTRNGVPVQVVQMRSEFRFERIDAAGWNRRRLDQEIAGFAYQPLDLESGPVFRATLFERSACDYVFLMTAHHIVMDGWSLWIVLDELMALYRARKSGIDARLPTPPADYAEFVRWQEETLAGPEGDKLWSYWQSELDRLPVIDLPIAQQRPLARTFNGSEHWFRIDRDLTEELKQLAVANQTTLYVVLLSVFKVLLHRYTGLDDLVVGSPLSARTRVEFEGAVGCFVNLVLIRADLGGAPSFVELLDQVRRKVLNAFEYGDYPFHLLAEKLQMDRDPSRPPLFQISFILQKPQRVKEAVSLDLNHEVRPSGLGDLHIKILPVGRKFARTDLELEMMEVDNDLSASIQFNTDLFRAEDIARMAGHYQRLLKGVVATPSKKIWQLPILTDREERQILQKWNKSGKNYPPSATVLELLQKQVAETPMKIAAVDGENFLAYGQLNERAERVANLIARLKK